MVNIKRALEIKGWMSDTELTWLGNQALTHKVIVEVGCYAGRSTRVLGEHTPGQVIAIDDFLGVPDERPLSPEKQRALFLEFKANLKDLIPKKVVPLYPDNVSFLDKKGLTPDMVFIDGDHSYDAVVNDINYWGPRLVPGGLLCGHDSNYGPIQKALQELIPTVGYAPQSSIWYVKK